MPVVETNGVRTYHETDGEGPPVVFLHGAFSDHRTWAERARPLADDHRVVVYDLRGHGRTGGSDLASYSMDTYVADLHALVSELDLDAPVLVGLSMGGMIAGRYAATHADALSGLVTVGAITSDTHTFPEWVERRLWLPTVDRLASTFGGGRVMPVVQRVNDLKRDQGESGDLEEKARIEEDHAADYPDVSDAESEKVRNVLMHWAADSTDYARISVPTLVMYGERETDLMARHARTLAETVPDGRVREIPGAGHNSHVDNPEFVRDELRDFLADIEHQS